MSTNMSRSIHTTWRKIFEERRWNYDVDQKRERIAQLKKDMSRKRTIKDTSDRSSRQEVLAADGMSMPSIVVRTKSEYEHFPASPADIENVIARLPRGTADGLRYITLSTGLEAQSEYEHYDVKTEEDRDPYIGRVGHECWPGTFTGSILGQYFDATNDMYIYSYVYGPEIPFKPVAELYLRCHMLSSLVHELAHHHDLSDANRRGKWHLTEEVRETFAVRRECDWTQNYVLPYVTQHYPSACQEFEDWVEEYGGIQVPLDQFFVDRLITKDLNTFNISIRAEMLDYAIEELASSALTHESPRVRQLRFATDLRIGQRLGYAELLTERLLELHPGDAEIIIERAEQLEDRSEFDRAEKMLKPLLVSEHRLDCALILCKIYAGQKRWPELLDIAESSAPEFTDAWMFSEVKRWQALALFKLGHHQQFDELRSHIALHSATSARRLDALLKAHD